MAEIVILPPPFEISMKRRHRLQIPRLRFHDKNLFIGIKGKEWAEIILETEKRKIE